MLSRSDVTVRPHHQELLARSPIALRNFLFEYPCIDHQETDPCQSLRGSGHKVKENGFRQERARGSVMSVILCHLKASGMYDEVWLAREGTRLVRRGLFQYGKRSGVSSWPMRNALIHTAMFRSFRGVKSSFDFSAILRFIPRRNLCVLAFPKTGGPEPGSQ